MLNATKFKSVEAVGYISGADSQYIYTGGSRGVIRIWDTKSRREITQSAATYNEDKETGGILDIMYLFSSIHANEVIITRRRH